jgi:hypothetical protein
MPDLKRSCIAREYWVPQSVHENSGNHYRQIVGIIIQTRNDSASIGLDYCGIFSAFD